MSIQNTPAQLARFNQALANHEITPAQYQQATGINPEQTINTGAKAVVSQQPTPQTQTPVQTLLDERAVFESQHQAGNINDTDYSTVMQFNQQQLNNAGYNVTPTYSTTSAPAPRPTPDFVGPMPTKITSFEATPIPTATPQPTPTQPTAPLSIGEQIANFNPAQAGADLGSWLFKTITGKEVSPQYKQNLVNTLTTNMGSGIPGIQGTPTGFLGGLVSSVESPIYAVGTLVGVKNLPKPPVATNAIISSGFDSVASGKFVESQEMQELNAKNNPAFAAGTFAGDLLLTFGYGKAVGTATKIISSSKIPIISKAAQIMGGVSKTGITQTTIPATAGRILTNVGAQAGIGYVFGGPEGAVKGAVVGAIFSGAAEFGGRIRPPSMNQLVYGVEKARASFLNKVSPDWHEPITIRDYPPKGSAGWGGTFDMKQNTNGSWQPEWMATAKDVTPYRTGELSAPNKIFALENKYVPTAPTENIGFRETVPTQTFGYSRNTAKLNSWGYERSFTPRSTVDQPLMQPEFEPLSSPRKTIYAEPTQYPEVERLLQNSGKNSNTELASFNQHNPMVSKQKTGELNSWGYSKRSSQYSTGLDLDSIPMTQVEREGYMRMYPRPVTTPAIYQQPNPKTNIRTQPQPQFISNVGYSPISVPIIKPNPDPYTRPQPQPKPQPIYYPQPQPEQYPDPFINPTTRQKQTSSTIPPFGSIAGEHGSNSQSYPNFLGVRSKRRLYDIATASEFLGV